MDEKDLAQEKLKDGPNPNSRYRHYKGGEYIVIGCGLQEETLEPLVIYKSPKDTLWVRTLKNWSESVTLEDGTNIARFTLISQTQV